MNAIASSVLGSRTAPLALAAALVLAFAVQLVEHAVRSSPTVDEPYHIVAGQRYLECGDFGINAEHPPLAKLLAALPLRALRLTPPDGSCGDAFTPLVSGYQEGEQFVVANGIGRVVRLARLSVVVVSLVLALLVGLAALEMFGRGEALVALALVAFEPTLVAHGSLVTTDMLFTAGAFAAAFFLYRNAVLPSVVSIVAAGLAAGVALATKHSALVALPVVCALPLVDRVAVGPRSVRDLARGLGTGAAVASMAVVVLWSSYGFRFAALPHASGPTPTVTQIVESTPHPEAANTPLVRLAAVAERLHVVPQAYAWGLGYVAGYGERSTYLLGSHFSVGQWFYFPIALSIKASLPLLVLLLVGLATRRLYRERGRAMRFLLAPSLAFFAAAMASSLNIGIRHVLLVFPFFAIVAAAGAGELVRRHRFGGVLVGALIVFHVATAIWTAPDDLAFANGLWGGTSATYRLLHDSNVDWGQSLGEAATYLEREPAGNRWLATHGNPAIARVLLPDCRPLPAIGWANGDVPVEAVPPVIDGTLLIGASVLAEPAGAVYAPITSTPPADVIGGSILVYRGRFEVPLVAAASHLDRADQLTRLGRLDEAVDDARAAVDLAPADAWARLALGTALARVGRLDGARAALASASAAARANPAAFREAGERADALLATMPGQ